MKHVETRKQPGTTPDKPAPSPFVNKLASKIARAANGLPILDIASGSGRNAMVFVDLGCEVICVDISLSLLEAQLSSGSHTTEFSSHFSLKTLDLVNDPWPFGSATVGAIIVVDFLLPTLFTQFEYSLIPGGYLLIETVSGRGGNYLQLPTAGTVKSALQHAFAFDIYEERKVGPVDSNAATVKLLARRLSDP